MTKGDRPRPRLRAHITGSERIKAIFAKAFGEKSKSSGNRARVRFAMTHSRKGIQKVLNSRGITIAEIPHYYFVGWNYGKKWTGEDLVKIRAVNGVGRPPDPARR